MALNIAAELDPIIAEVSHFAAAEPEIQEGWPSLARRLQGGSFSGAFEVLTQKAPGLAEGNLTYCLRLYCAISEE